MSIIIEVLVLVVWISMLSFASLLVATFSILALRYPSFIISHTTSRFKILECVCMNIGLFLFFFLFIRCALSHRYLVYIYTLYKWVSKKGKITFVLSSMSWVLHSIFPFLFGIITIIFMSFLLVLVHGEWITGIVDYGYDDDNGMRMGREACQRVKLNRKEAKSKN